MPIIFDMLKQRRVLEPAERTVVVITGLALKAAGSLRLWAGHPSLWVPWWREPSASTMLGLVATWVGLEGVLVSSFFQFILSSHLSLLRGRIRRAFR